MTRTDAASTARRPRRGDASRHSRPQAKRPRQNGRHAAVRDPHSALDPIDRAWLRRFRNALRRWHAKHGRDLPWRAAGDAYRVWVSEIMLQQTTVAAVRPYYERFLNRFPTVQSLAAADEQEVLRLWEGLGYYSRGRNLRRAAQTIVALHQGMLPGDVTQLRDLPGIGRYTAGAIASFAYDRPEPIVEANTLRLYCRLLGWEGDPRSATGQDLLWSFAAMLVPSAGAGEFNQALMDLGATVCTVGTPRCEDCPVRSCCVAFRDGKQSSIPRPAVKPEVTNLVEASVAVRDRGRYLVRLAPRGERWTGLWDFPRFAVQINGESLDENASLPLSLARQVSEALAQLTGVEIADARLWKELRHGVTRYRIRLLCCVATRTGGRLHRSGPELRWVAPREFGDLPFSTTGRKLARGLQQRHSVE